MGKLIAVLLAKSWADESSSRAAINLITNKGNEMGEYMAAQMDRQIEGAISTNEALCNENEYLAEMLRWAYSKLHNRVFSSMDDALMQDRIKLWLEHGIAG